MSVRPKSRLLVQAMVRRVHAEGGSAMVLAKGEEESGAILILATERGESPVFWERGIGPDGQLQLIRAGGEMADGEAVTAYWQRRRTRDPDLWVVELDIAQAERFAAETILSY